MYTEDDDKVVVNNDSNSDYANFYTSFINDEKKNNNKKNSNTKKKKKDIESSKENDTNFYSSFMENEKLNNNSKTKKESPSKKNEESLELKDEEDFASFYSNDEVKINNKDSKKNILKIVFFAVLLIIVVVLIIFLISKVDIFGNSNKPDIVLTNELINVNVGENGVISYKIVNTDLEVTSTFESVNQDIAIVDNNGLVTGISSGETEIIIKYTIDGKNYEKKCKVIVTGEGSVDKNLNLDVNIENAKEDEWTNKDVVINASARSIFGILSLKYSVNCEDGNCTYYDVTDNKIKVSENGVNKINIVATDRNNQQVQKFINIKIDKQNPEVIFEDKTNITSNKDVTVCATCKDSVSGCKQEKVCKKFTSSKSNQKIVVEDLAGNQSYTPSFNVKINKEVSPCSLSVSKDGTVTGSFKDGAKYYGFDSSYSGPKTKSKKIEINATKNGEVKAKLVYFYVVDSKNVKHSCYITVIKECTCSNNSNSNNCPVSCVFKSN